jgi:hypothetical protein
MSETKEYDLAIVLSLMTGRKLVDDFKRIREAIKMVT